MVTYYSLAWLEACRDEMNNSDKHMKKSRRLNGKFFFRVWDGPDGKDRRAVWEFADGKCTHVEFEARPAPWKELRDLPFDQSSYTGRFSCPFKMMAALNRGDMSPLKALSSPQYQVEGKKTQFFMMMQGVNSWNEHNARVKCNYDFTKTDDQGNAID
ncbi:MAG TPA: hypothetical protein ENN21_00370 [Spirochaetes bacterium]|nr:hypothetical protein [Spirochaetota bacterium]